MLYEGEILQLIDGMKRSKHTRYHKSMTVIQSIDKDNSTFEDVDNKV